METINYKLELFEGPLDLLVSLVEKHKLKIDDIPIDLLCEQYMAYINEAAEHNIDLACEFLYMASELMLIKSRMLLPRDPKVDDDPRRVLVDAIKEYQRAKMAASELHDLYASFGTRMVKETDDISPDRTYVKDHSVELLQSALLHALSESKVSEVKVKEEFYEIVHAPQIPVGIIMKTLLDDLKIMPIYLDGYFRQSESRSELIAKFLSVLELLKFKVISIDDELGEPETGVTNILTHAKITLLDENYEITADLLNEYQ